MLLLLTFNLLLLSPYVSSCIADAFCRLLSINGYDDDDYIATVFAENVVLS